MLCAGLVENMLVLVVDLGQIPHLASLCACIQNKTVGRRPQVIFPCRNTHSRIGNPGIFQTCIYEYIYIFGSVSLCLSCMGKSWKVSVTQEDKSHHPARSASAIISVVRFPSLMRATLSSAGHHELKETPLQHKASAGFHLRPGASKYSPLNCPNTAHAVALPPSG